ncbi:MAG: hypothetical protein K1X77_11525 [Bacteroidia bacterium]|nr:hypothetical protein [Bacteroidia bacterium]
MHDIEPFFNWRDFYVSSDDPRSPFFEREYSESEYNNQIYNFYLHPQWDYFGSETMYLKALYVDYEQGFAVIELIGEWNDAIGNDIMFLKRDVIDPMLAEGIRHFVLIGDNVLNFHNSDDCYYEEWFDELDDGWIIALNFREHVVNEFVASGLDQYILFSDKVNQLNWRSFQPGHLFDIFTALMQKRLST